MPVFPTPIRQAGGRLYFLRADVENYKLALAGLPPKTFDGPDVLVPAVHVAGELGFGRRTLGRRVAESEAQQTSASKAA